MKKNFTKVGYLHDTHTAVAMSAAEQYIADTNDKKPVVVASTASPYKFAADVLVSLGGKRPEDDLKALDELSDLTKTAITKPLRDIDKREVRFKSVIDAVDMQGAVKEYIK